MSNTLEELLAQARQDQQKKETAAAEQNSGDSDYLRFKKGCSYTLRLLVNTADPTKLFADWNEYGFDSVVSGQYVSLGRSPADAKREDVVDQIHWDAFKEAKKSGSDAELKRSHDLFPKQKQSVRVFVVDTDDEDLKEYIGKVSPKPLRYPVRRNKAGEILSQIYGVIHSAFSPDGKRHKALGVRMFDLSDNGVNLVIDVKDKHGWNDYDVEFNDYSEPLGLDADKREAILAEAAEQDLEVLIPETKTDAELREMINVHFYGTGDIDGDSDDGTAAVDANDSTDNIPFDFDEKKEEGKPSEVIDVEVDQELEEFMKEL